MVSPLKYYRRDPMNKNRGAGFYYKRSYKGSTRWMSKYDGSKDGVKRVHVGHKRLKGTYEHAGDRVATKRTHHRMNVSPRRKKTFMGWF